MKEKKDVGQIFSIKKALLFAWNTFLARPIFTTLVPMGVMVLVSIGAVIIGLSFAMIATLIEVFIVGSNLVAGIKIVISIIGLIIVAGLVIFILRWLIVANMFQIQLLLDVITGKDRTAKEIFYAVKDIKLASNFFGAIVLWILVVFLGSILFIIPGIILAIKYAFVPYLVLDKKMDIIESFKQSARMTNGYKWKLFVFFFLTSLILLIPSLLIGNLIMTVIMLMVSIYIYLMLDNKKNRLSPSTKKAPVIYVIIVFVISIVLNILGILSDISKYNSSTIS